MRASSSGFAHLLRTLDVPRPTEHGSSYLSHVEREAFQRTRTECEACIVGQVPREELVPFAFTRDGVKHAGLACPCKVKRVGAF